MHVYNFTAECRPNFNLSHTYKNERNVEFGQKFDGNRTSLTIIQQDQAKINNAEP